MSIVTIDENLEARILSLLDRQLAASGNTARKKALDVFKSLGLPSTKHEEYKYTPILRALEKNFSFQSIAPASALTVSDESLIPGLNANVLVFVNGRYAANQSKIVSNNLTISELSDQLIDSNEVARQHFSKYVQESKDAFAAWNNAGWTSGIFIHLKANTVVEEPVVIVNLTDARASEVISNTRNLFVLERNSAITVIERSSTEGTNPSFNNSVTEVSVDENAHLELYRIQNDGAQRYEHNLTEIYQKNSSRVNTYTFTLEGKLIRNNLHIALDGQGVESHMYGLYLLGNDTLADNHTVVDHKQANSFSNELYKGVMDGTSKGVFNGKIYVRPNAQKTNAFQANRNILLSDRATVNTKPQLEIWADDVKCSHGCTSGQIDEEALFYLQARGISKETARAMMLYAFAGEVIDHIQHPAIKTFIDGLVSERLHKKF